MGTGWSQEGEAITRPQEVVEEPKLPAGEAPVAAGVTMKSEQHHQPPVENRPNSHQTVGVVSNTKKKVEEPKLPLGEAPFAAGVIMKSEHHHHPPVENRPNSHQTIGVVSNTKKEQVEVKEKGKVGSFMVSARDLSITWAEDSRYWSWISLKETASGRDVEAAQLINVCWLEIHGRFETAKLSSGTVYEVVFAVMLKDPAYGWEVPVNLRLQEPDGKVQEHKVRLVEKRRGEWIEIVAGEYVKKGNEKAGDSIDFSMFEYDGGLWKRGLVIKGVLIRPKK